MSTKYFHWGRGAQEALENVTYVEGAPVAYSIRNWPVLVIEAWHGIPQGAKTALIARLVADGWIEGEHLKD